MNGITNDNTNCQNTNTCSPPTPLCIASEPIATRCAAPTTPNGAYRAALFSGVPLFTTRLVRERTFDFATSDQLRSPADAAAVLANAAAVLIAHNHPSGNPEPSREDVAVTKQLVEAGKVMGIPVHDHLILTDNGHTSLAKHGMM